MHGEDFESDSGEPQLPIAFADDPEQIEKAGHFTLALIRRTAAVAREAALGEHPANDEAGAEISAETSETTPEQDDGPAAQAMTCDMLLAEAQRGLLDRAEEAKASNRRFVDASALLQAANEEVVNLKNALQEKNQEISRLKRDAAQVVSYVQVLLGMIEELQSTARHSAPIEAHDQSAAV